MADRPIDALDTWELLVVALGGAFVAGLSIPWLMMGLSDLLLMLMGFACAVWLVADFIDGLHTDKIMKER